MEGRNLEKVQRDRVRERERKKLIDGDSVERKIEGKICHTEGENIIVCRVERGRALLYQVYRRKNNLGRDQ